MMDDTQARLARMDKELETEMRDEIALAVVSLQRMAFNDPRLASAMAQQALAVMGAAIDDVMPEARAVIEAYILPDESGKS